MALSKKDHKKFKYVPVKLLSKGQKRILVVVLVFGVLIHSAAMFLSNNITTNKKMSQSLIHGETVASGIAIALSENAVTTTIMKDLYLEYGDLLLQDFDRLCERFINDNAVIGSLYFAPYGVVKYVYPKELYEKTYGYNMLKDPLQSSEAIRAVKIHGVTVAGPHALIEGGKGFILRNPIFVNNEFVGFSIAVIDYDQFIKQVSRFMDLNDSSYKLALFRDDNDGLVVDRNGFIFSNTDSKISHKLVIDIKVPNDVWHMYLEPTEGWRDKPSQFILGIVGLVFLIIIMVLVYLRQVDQYLKLYSADHDTLTNLYTREKFFKKVEKLFKENPEKQYDVLISDIQNFKVINSVYGTDRGDEVLCYLANTFLLTNRDGLTARYAGDKFIMVYPSDQFGGADYLQELLDLIVRDSPIPTMNVKFGYYGNVDKSLSVNLICDRALMAVRSILHNYNEQVANYQGSISMENIRIHGLESTFEEAINKNNFKLWFQPKFDAHSEKLIGFEALVRWHFDDGRVVAPGDFVGVFEEDGLVVRLDEYVFKKTCMHIKTWIDSSLPVKPVSVNLSRITMQQNKVIRKYSEIVEKYELPINLVPLEITESASTGLKELEILAKELKNTGFRIHMDDFGSGLSSLECLNVLPFDAIKLDKSLVSFIGTEDGEELLRHSIELAHFKKLSVIAEGVENETQLEFLRKVNCDVIQGFYYSPPIPADEVPEYLAKMYREYRV